MTQLMYYHFQVNRPFKHVLQDRVSGYLAQNTAAGKNEEKVEIRGVF